MADLHNSYQQSACHDAGAVTLDLRQLPDARDAEFVLV